MGTHLRVLSESFLMDTKMTGFRWFSKFYVHPCAHCALDKSSLSIGRIQPFILECQKKPEQFWWYLIAQLIFLITFEGGMVLWTQTTTLLQISCESMLIFIVIFKRITLMLIFVVIFKRITLMLIFVVIFKRIISMLIFVVIFKRIIFISTYNVIHTCAIFVKGIPRHNGNPQAWIGLNRTKTPSEWILSWVIRIALCEVWNNTDHSSQFSSQLHLMCLFCPNLVPKCLNSFWNLSFSKAEV